ncbi:MAG TPA: SRPBCC family protein [Actinomycetota bacterium]|nr:SRPBCC family protein [Actinomycetota bacterium]
METQRKGNALKGEIVVRVQESIAASAEVVYDLLADVGSHLEWGGTRQKKTFRLLSIDAPEGQATVGTEFSSSGADAMGTFKDTSVVTEATRPSLFEFVTEARLSTKKGTIVEWTLVHRYEIGAKSEGCTVTYTNRTVRISELPGALRLFNVPGLRALLTRVARSNVERGFRNLVMMADQRATTR